MNPPLPESRPSRAGALHIVVHRGGLRNRGKTGTEAAKIASPMNHLGGRLETQDEGNRGWRGESSGGQGETE